MMYRSYISLLMYAAIFIVSIMVLYPYLTIGMWALIIVISVWPAYKHWCHRILKNRRVLAASTFTIFVAILIILPIAWVAYIAVGEFTAFAHTVTTNTNPNAFALPQHIANLPYIGDSINQFWQKYINNPQQIKEYLSSVPISYSKAGEIALMTFKIMADFFFMLLIVFFMLLNGESLSTTIQRITRENLPRFSIYLEKSILVIRSVLTSMIYTGAGTGIILGALYYYLDVPLAAFFGIISMLATAIPFGLAAVLFVVCVIMLLQAKMAAMLAIMIIGTLVSLLIDNWLRPAILEKYVSMHFLAAFFGVLGGIEAFGLIGIYIGPIIMVLLSITWQEITAERPRITTIENEKDERPE